ncbi:hypothetical protein [Streptomyces sp. NBC_00299]|uniref:hypothetical protein n=1 Tax=Streptomyces sp. NBC_00299 TaxID=2975705 RepID=UPI002E2C5472|nr:hypothetical protein [Streptomyces sp. NBC_00299]
MSAVSGCASQASSPKPAAAQARTLSQKELEAARLTQGEASGYGVALGNETPADMKPVVTTTTPEICLPAMKLLRHGWADGAVGYTRFHLSDPANSVGAKSVALTSYPPGQAKQVFASVEKSLKACPSVVYKSVHSVRAKLTLGGPLEPGDESLRVNMDFSMNGIENHTVYGLVRSSDVLVWFNINETFGSTLPKQKKADFMPVLPTDLVLRQVEKVEAALEATATP